MKLIQLLLTTALVCVSFTASADRWHGQNDQGRSKAHQRHYEYQDGHCKVKREYKRNGDYKEKRTCKRPSKHAHHHRDRHSQNDIIISLPSIVLDPVIRIGR